MEKHGESVKDLLLRFDRELAGLYPPEEIRSIAGILFEEYLGWSRAQVWLSRDVDLQVELQKRFSEALSLLATGMPVQYVTGKAWFNGLPLHVNESVLIPRPETEEMCDRAGSMLNGIFPGGKCRILDIGTGSGCIAIDLKRRIPLAEVVAIDISNEALDTAAGNAREAGCAIDFRKADMLNETEWPALGRFDAVISNPPYVTDSERTAMRRNVTAFEPARALYVPDNDPLKFYRRITDFCSLHLQRPGMLFLEINERFGNEIRQMLEGEGFGKVEIIKDIHSRDRFVSATSEWP